MSSLDPTIKISPKKRDSPSLGQRIIVVHPPQIAKVSRLSLLRAFCPTDIGIFRSARNHERHRPKGAPQTIFIYCARGSGWCDIGNKRHAIRENQLLAIPSNCPHAYGASNKDPWTIEWFHAIGSGIPEHLKRLRINKSSPVLTLRPDAWDSSLFGEAIASLENGLTDLQITHAALTLGHLLSRITAQIKEGTDSHTSVSARLEKTIAHMRENYSKSLGVSDWATIAGFSTSHFTSLFLKHTGHPPTDYFIRIRIGQACRLLDTTSLSIKEISEKVGYSDPYYFSRIFKKSTSCSPRNYRNISKG